MLRDKVMQFSKKHGLSHLSSCLTAIDIIEEIYKTKNSCEPFILSCGHAGVALYVVLDRAEFLWRKHGTHPNRDKDLDCSTGSLGQGLPIAVGMALADRKKNVYCLISDGECDEGSIWEALRIAREQKLTNLKVYLNMNGWSAYKSIDKKYLVKRIKAFEFPVDIRETNVDEYPELAGLKGHYEKAQ